MLSIFVSSYRRPKLLKILLDSLEDTIFNAPFEIQLHVGLVDAQFDDVNVASTYLDLNHSKHISKYTYTPFHWNCGKAHVLNTFYKEYGQEASHILVIDQDMVYHEPFVPHLMRAMELDCDLVGFGGIDFWYHRPDHMELQAFLMPDDYRIYEPMGYSGAMMLVDGRFQKNYEWTNYYGIFGGEDVDISINANSKLVLYHHSKWAEHDPFALELYPEYHAKKAQYDIERIMVLEEGWDR